MKNLGKIVLMLALEFSIFLGTIFVVFGIIYGLVKLYDWL